MEFFGTSRTRIAVCASIVLLAVHSSQQAAAAEPAAANPTASPAAADPQAQARAVLLGMARFLAGTPRYSVSLRSGYDAVQASGQKIEFGAKRTVTVRRPDRLRVDAEDSSGETSRLLFDGKDITLTNLTRNVYAQAAKAGDIDAAVKYFVDDLQMRLPLAVMLLSGFPAELERRVETVDYVESTKLLGAPAHHLAGHTATVDFQIWVADGARPLPLRVVLTYRNETGQPQFWGEFTDWNLAPEVGDATFAFTSPAGAQKIEFLARMRPPIAAVQPVAKKAGDQQ